MPQNLLTWNDAIKLCVPFLFSLILLWAKQWYEKRLEWKSKSEMLWRETDQQSSELSKTLQELERIAEAYTSGRMRLVSIVLPPSAISVGVRLGELDYRHAHLFTDYVTSLEVVRYGLTRLERLTDRAIERGKDSLGSLPNAIRAQVTSLKQDFVSLAASQLEVMKVVQASQRRFDPQVISRLAACLREAERATAAVTSNKPLQPTSSTGAGGSFEAS